MQTFRRLAALRSFARCTALDGTGTVVAVGEQHCDQYVWLLRHSDAAPFQLEVPQQLISLAGANVGPASNAPFHLSATVPSCSSQHNCGSLQQPQWSFGHSRRRKDRPFDPRNTRGFSSAAKDNRQRTPGAQETVPRPGATDASQLGAAAEHWQKSHRGDSRGSVDNRVHAASTAEAGWTRQEVWNAPNIISLARLASGPVIAYWIATGQTPAALTSLLVAGWSDWLDGYVARRFNQTSTIGTYLDPLADKVLICCVVAALGVQGTLPGYLATIIIGRDMFLVGAAFAHRAHVLQWRRVSLAEFFKVAAPGAQEGEEKSQCATPAAAKVKPLYISKLNTVLQLGTVGGFLMHAGIGWPPEAALSIAAAVTAGITVVSGVAYIRAYVRGKILR